MYNRQTETRVRREVLWKSKAWWWLGYGGNRELHGIKEEKKVGS